ncbi:MAG: exonuclease SbcCD subunit D [Caldilineaceae bacterium]|nr:exonuclease SbcCD subunit D [Caldilineaceae bacterium]
MKSTFLHVADCHLGKWQYNLRERFNDFGRAFHHIIDEAIAANVDFVILAGDLFEKRAIDALTLNQAMRALDKLHSRGIPCLAIEGNHERPYFSERVGWMEFLAVRDLLILLTPTFVEGKPELQPYKNRRGSYFDPVPGVRVHGLRYFGAGTFTAIESYAQALAAQPTEGVEYTIFMAHAGVEGVLADQSGGLSHRQWSVLQPHVDYLALGHVHKPFSFDGWIYNPGSPESCSVVESDWKDRGYYLVTVDTERAQATDTAEIDAEEGSATPRKHDAILHTNPRRTFHRFSVKTDLLTSPVHLLDYCREFLERKARDIGPHRAEDRPVVELQLTGVLPFERSALDLDALEAIINECFQPLMTLVRNYTRSGEISVEGAESMSRAELERQVLIELLDRDSRFQAQSETWVDVALQLKQLALSGAGGEAILAELGERL